MTSTKAIFRGRLSSFLFPRVYIIILAIMSIIIARLEFPWGSLPIGGDTFYPAIDPSILTHYSTAWNQWVDLGTNVPQVLAGPPLPELLILSLLQSVGPNISTAAWLYLATFSTIGACSMAYLFRIVLPQYSKQQVACMISGTVFLVNPSLVVDTFKSAWLLLPERALFPLFTGIFIEGCRKRSLRYSIGCGIITLFLFQTFPVGTAQYAVAAVLVVAGYLLVSTVRSQNRRQVLEFSFKHIAVAAAISILVNLYLLYPILVNLSSYSSTLSGFSLSRLALNASSTPFNAVRLLSYWGFYNGFAPYSSVYSSNIIVTLSTVALPGFAFGTMLVDKTKRVLGLLSITAIGIFLAKGNNEPFGQVFTALVSTPILKVFYIASTIIPFVVVFYSMLLPAFYQGVVRLSAGFSRLSRVSIMGATLVLLFSSLAIASWPLFTGDVSTNYLDPSQRGVTIPAEYSSLRQWLASNGGQYRTLLAYSPSTYISTTWGYQGATQLYHTYFTSPIVTGTGTPYSTETPLLSYVYGLQHFTTLRSNATITLGNSTNTPWQLHQEDQITIRPGIQNYSAINWRIQTKTIAFHQISYVLPSSQDWSKFDVMSVWISNESDISALRIGIMDSNNFVGWYDATSHLARSIGNWTQLILPLQDPDTSQYDAGNVTALWAESSSPQGSFQVSFTLFQVAKKTYDSTSWAKLLATAGVKWILQDQSLIEGSWNDYGILRNADAFKVAFSGGFLTLYSNQFSQNSVYAATEVEHVENLLQVVDSIVAAKFNPASTIFLIDSNESSMLTFGNSTVNLSVRGTQSAGYSVSGYSTGPFVLVLDQQFDSMWELITVNGPSPAHIEVDGYSNGWFIPAGKAFEYRLLYALEASSTIARSVSALALVASSLGLVLPLTRAQVLARRMSRLPKHIGKM